MLSLVHITCLSQVSKGCSACHGYFGTQDGFVSIYTSTVTTEEGRRWNKLYTGLKCLPQNVTSVHISMAKVRLAATPNFISREAGSQRAQKAESQKYFMHSPHGGQGWSPPGSPGGAIEVFEFN